MARRLIGLDIGTNAVTVAEIEAGDVPTLRAFGQVALPPDAMREGEVVDEAAVTEAIQRLWREVGLRKGAVRVGLASPRVIVRPVELPTMSEDDLAGALRFQAQELIPIPVDEAVLDFQVLETVPGQEPGASTSRVLLAAAHRETVDRLVRAVRGAGLDVDAVDLVPLALVRSLGRRVTGDGEGAEAFVSIGAGVTVVVVHEAGLPRFVRILGVGGRSLTEAVARDLDVAFDTAEALKRQTAGDGLAEQARLAMERPLSVLLEEVRGSLDFYRSQADSLPLLRVLLTGGTARLPGLEERLRRLVDVPVEQADPRSTLVIGDIGFTGDEFEQLDPFLPVAVGLALGGLAAGRRINLLGAAARRRADRRGCSPPPSPWPPSSPCWAG
ncbi:MAG: type IV pilus assembly protein PilM [Acidimicrobiia bacterium]|nr:type IV pilus assembly protein PilM [Acidimicrobiia bacterium]